MPISVLFVCLGNICRSPMAEAVFRDVVKNAGLESQFDRIDSAGTAGYHVGDMPDSRTIKICRAKGVAIDHRGKQLKPDDFVNFDFILCMDDSNLSNADRIRPKSAKAKLQLFGDYDPNGERIIEDPYYGGFDGFEHNFEQVKRASLGFLKEQGLM
ncbi:hypothetical protein HDU67_010103 [Dinochytrium kinnereticum]|nr:hypothetical protein HDU67_010103 [Dinochytrium kinnereticum]